MESVVRIARIVGREPRDSERRGPAARKLAAGATALCEQSIRWQTAHRGPSGGLSVLVHHARRTRAHRRVVAARSARRVCTDGQARRRRQHHLRQRLTSGMPIAIAERMGNLLWLIIVILVILWLGGFAMHVGG